jgi:hypothetical protein
MEVGGVMERENGERGNAGFSPNSVTRIGRYLIGGILVIVVLIAQGIADFENLRFRIPSYQELMRSEGVAFFDSGKEFKRGLPLGIKTKTEVIFVTCRTSDTFQQDCVARRDRADLEGRHIVVLWSEQPIFLWRKEKRAFQIEVDGKVFRSYEDMVEKYSTRFSVFHIGTSLAIYFCVFFLIAYLVIGKRQTRKDM